MIISQIKLNIYPKALIKTISAQCKGFARFCLVMANYLWTKRLCAKSVINCIQCPTVPCLLLFTQAIPPYPSSLPIYSLIFLSSFHLRRRVLSCITQSPLQCGTVYSVQRGGAGRWSDRRLRALETTSRQRCAALMDELILNISQLTRKRKKGVQLNMLLLCKDGYFST